MTKTFDIFADVHNLLQVLILAGTPDWIIYNPVFVSKRKMSKWCLDILCRRWNHRDLQPKCALRALLDQHYGVEKQIHCRYLSNTYELGLYNDLTL